MKAKTPCFACLIVLAVCGIAVASPSQMSAGDSGELRGKRWIATSVTKDGEPHELVEGSKLWVDFRRSGSRDVVAWRAGCNFFGAEYEIDGAAIVTGAITGTEMGCRRKLMRQDAFFVRFFSRDPKFAVEGDEFTLSTRRVAIELVRKP